VLAQGQVVGRKLQGVEQRLEVGGHGSGKE
jgi:hypothetical protein